MSSDSYKVTIHMVSSLDGFIATKDNDVSWFETPDYYEQGDDVEESTEIDCYVMGSRTYEHALELSKTYGWVYGDLPTIVLTHRNLPIERNNVKTYAGDLYELLHEQLKPHYQKIWIVGGAMLAKEFIHLQLAHEIRLIIMPIILGDGTLFLDHIGQRQTLHLKNVKAYKSGTVELCYEIQKE